MGKIDDMRKRREQQHAQQEEESAAKATIANGVANGVHANGVHANGLAPAAKQASVEAASEPRAPVASSQSRARSRTGGEEEEGRCSVCGKVRPLQNGVVSNHQKGLGKMCPGSRKEPA